MIKTTIKDAKNKAYFTDLKELRGYLKAMNLTVKEIEKIAYTQGTYGCNGYLIRIETTTTIKNEVVKGHTLYAFTGRSSWMYNCTSLWVYNNDVSE